MRPIAYCSKNTKKQLLLSAVVSPKLMRERETVEVWATKICRIICLEREDRKKKVLQRV